MQGFTLVIGSGIGKETCLTFAERGAQGIAIADINVEAAQKTAHECRDIASSDVFQTLDFKVDATNKSAMQSMVDEVVKQFGRIDHFVNSAGIEPRSIRSIGEADLDEFDALHSVNTKGMLVGIAVVSEAMKKQDERFIEGRHGRRSIGRGSVVNVVSVAAFMASAGMAQYIASKYGALGVTKVALPIDAGVTVTSAAR